MSVDELTPQALKLSIRERALLAASLWESLGDPYEGDWDEEKMVALAEHRDAELEAGTATALSHAEVMKRLRHGN